MSERVWTVFPGPKGHAAKLAWSLREALARRGFRVGRVLRADWGYRVELPGLELDLYDHPEEPGLLQVALRVRGRLSRVLARARFAKAAGVVDEALADLGEVHPAATD